MGSVRRERINDAVFEEVAVILREIKDPRISSVMITVTGAEVSGDLKYAKIFYSVLGEYDEKELKKGLKSVSPYVRSRLAHSLNLRQTPEISFVKDESVQRGAEISSLLKKILPAEEGQEGKEDGDGN
ncbi:MAG: 30S ribosome-binding factor RbfA [Clostridia bacterium]|nr:30S ribosome-binding factor RbfA [Clostridia bacterium]